MHATLLLVAVWALLVSAIAKKDNNQQNCNKKVKYDYIVVGGGTSGSIVASELALANANDDILLIEEGYFSRMNPKITNVKRENIAAIQGGEDVTMDRGYYTIEQRSLNNRTIFLPIAKVTGGCGSHNTQVFTFANENDFKDRWGDITGWTLDDILPIWDIIESVTYTGSKVDASNSAFLQRFLSAGEILGFELNDDWNDLRNGSTQDGISSTLLQSHKLNDTYYERGSAWNDFLEVILPRDNLDILTQTRVNKILVDNGNAKGVETYNLGTFETMNYYAKKEIIISAGTYDTPKLLLLSGIGDCDELDTLYNMECEANVAGVGKNLIDHVVAVIIAPPVLNETQFFNEIDRDAYDSLPTWSVISFAENGKFEHIGQLISLTDDEDDLYVIVACILNHVTSRGSVTLQDTDPDSRPLIDINYLSTTEDKINLVEAIKMGREFLYDTGAFDDLLFGQEYEISPGYGLQSDEEILFALKYLGLGVSHPVGTSKMGDNFQDDEMVVVNSRLQVKNMDNLRVVDASIMPNSISAHTNQMSMVIGYKGAQMIIEDNN